MVAGFRREVDMVAPVRAHLEALGFRVYANADGADYFDVIARRAGEIGLVELKQSDARTVFVQALRRRTWGDWVAVALASDRAAERLLHERAGPLSVRVGIWSVRPEGVRVLRPAYIDPDRTAVSEPRPEREALEGWLDRVDDGSLPSDMLWEGLGAARRRFSHGRGFREWTLEEASPSAEGERPERQG